MADEFDKAIRRKTKSLSSLKFEKVQPGEDRKRVRFSGGQEDLDPITSRTEKMSEVIDKAASDDEMEDMEAQLVKDITKYREANEPLPDKSRRPREIEDFDQVEPDQAGYVDDYLVKDGSPAQQEMLQMKSTLESRYPGIVRMIQANQGELSERQFMQIKREVLGNIDSPSKKRDEKVLEGLIMSDLLAQPRGK